MNLQDLFTFQTTPEKRLKFTYNGNKEITVLFTLFLRGNREFHSTKFTFYTKDHWVVLPFSYIGCTHISLHDVTNDKHICKLLLPVEITKGIDKQNIICIGLNKTGTSSFTKDFIDLGYSFLPETHGILNILADVYHGDYHSLYSVLDNPLFNAYEDLPFSLPNIYKKIYEYRPNDIFILTVRENPEKWVKSVINYYPRFFKNEDSDFNNFFYTYYTSLEKINYLNFDIPLLNSWGIKKTKDVEEHLKNVYEKHNKEVIEFFESKNSPNLIVIDVSKKGELKRLTNWLGVNNEKQNFTWINKSL
jgi:hypothetical protein